MAFQTASEEDLPSMLTQKMILKHKNPKEEGPEPIAPYPPLCFRVNAKPPPGTLYYFAYGLDMNPDRMSTYFQRNMQKRFWGLLFGFQLKFNKRGADSDAGGFPNIEFNPYTSVEGTLYCITEEELKILDKHVGYPKHFEHIMLPVWMINCLEPDEYGVAQYCVPALMYMAQDEWTVPDHENLSAGYSLGQCIKSADLLTPAYRDYLENIGDKQLDQELSIEPSLEPVKNIEEEFGSREDLPQMEGASAPSTAQAPLTLTDEQTL